MTPRDPPHWPRTSTVELREYVEALFEQRDKAVIAALAAQKEATAAQWVAHQRELDALGTAIRQLREDWQREHAILLAHHENDVQALRLLAVAEPDVRKLEIDQASRVGAQRGASAYQVNLLAVLALLIALGTMAVSIAR